MRREPNDLKDQKKKKKKKATKKVKPPPPNGEAAAANGEASSAQPGSGRVRRRDRLLQSLTALVGVKGDDARARADSQTPGFSNGNGMSTIEEEEEEDEDVVEERRLAAKRSEAADRIFAQLNSGPPPPPGTLAHPVASTSSSRPHRPVAAPRPGQPGAALGGPGPAAVGALGLPPKARPNANRNRNGPPPAASARFAAMSAAASGHPQYGPGAASGVRAAQGKGSAGGSLSPWADPGAHVVGEQGPIQGSAGGESSQGRRPQHVRYASLDEAAAAVLQRAGSFSHPASAADPGVGLASPAPWGSSLQPAGGRPGSSGVPELPRLGTAQSRGQLSSRGSVRSYVEDDLVSEADQESVLGYDDDTGFPLLSGGTAHVLVIPEEGEAVHGKIDTRYMEAERPLDLSHFRRVLSFVYGDEPSPMDGLKIREVDKIMLAVHGMEGLLTDDEGGEGSPDESEEEDDEDGEEEEGGGSEEEGSESEDEEEEEEEGGGEKAGGSNKEGSEEGIDPRIRDPLLREILTKELVKFLAESADHTNQSQPQSQAQPVRPRARPATADGRFHSSSPGQGGMLGRLGTGEAGGEGGKGPKKGTSSQLSVSAKEARDLGGAGQAEESGEEASGIGADKGKGEGEAEGKAEGEGGAKHRRTGSLDLRTEISRLSGEDALRILMSARESFQRTVEEQAQKAKGRGHVRASSLLAGEALETNLVRGITRVYSQQNIYSSIAEGNEEVFSAGQEAQGSGEGSGRGAPHAHAHWGQDGAKNGKVYGQKMGQIRELVPESEAPWEQERGKGEEGEGGRDKGRGWESEGWESDRWKRDKERERGGAWQVGEAGEWDAQSEGGGAHSSGQRHAAPSTTIQPPEWQRQGEAGHNSGQAHHRHAPAPGPEYSAEASERSVEDELNTRRPIKPGRDSGMDGPRAEAQAAPGAPQLGQAHQRRTQGEPSAATWPPEDHRRRQGGMISCSSGTMQYSDKSMQYNDKSMQYSDNVQQYNGTGQHRSTGQHDDSEQRERGQRGSWGEAREWESEQGRRGQGEKRGNGREWEGEPHRGWGQRAESNHSGFGGGRNTDGTPADGAAHHQRGYSHEYLDDGWGEASGIDGSFHSARSSSTSTSNKSPSIKSASDSMGSFHSTWSNSTSTSNRSTSNRSTSNRSASIRSTSDNLGSFHSTWSGSTSTSNRSTSNRSISNRSSSNKSSSSEWEGGGGAPASSQWAAQGQEQRGSHKWPQEATQSPSPGPWPVPPHGVPPHRDAHGMPQKGGSGQGPSREWPQQGDGYREKETWEEHKGHGGGHKWPEQQGAHRVPGAPQAAWPGQEGEARSDGGWGSNTDWETSQTGNRHRAPPAAAEYGGSAEPVPGSRDQGPRHRASHSDQVSYQTNAGHYYSDQVPHHRSTYSDQRDMYG